MWQLFGNENHYQNLYIILGGLVAAIVLFGFGYEMVRRGRKRNMGAVSTSDEMMGLNGDAEFEI